MFADHVGVALAGRGLDLVGGKPGLFDVVFEALAAAAQVAEAPGFDQCFGPLPGLVGLPLGGEGSGGSLPSAQVTVEREVADAAVLADAGSRGSHAI